MENNSPVLQGEDKKPILFLGTADSGKSTLFNQIMLMYSSGGLTEVYKRHAVVKRLLNILVNYFNLFDDDSRCQSNRNQFIQDIIYNKISFEDLYIKNKEKFRKNLFIKLKENYHKLDSVDNVEYLLNNLERILIKNEITDLDFLSSYYKTTRLLKHKTLTNNTIVTAGGIINERRKWVYIFNNVVTLVIFVSLSEFNQTCFESTTTNRLTESLQTFKELSYFKWFEFCDVLLLFTKVDCFIKKINSGIQFSNYFNDFTGNNYNFKEVFEYIVEKFRKLCKGKELRYCALNCLDKFECLQVQEIIENIANYKYQHEMFINRLLLLNDKNLKQIFTKLYQSVLNLNFCDIELFIIDN